MEADIDCKNMNRNITQDKDLLNLLGPSFTKLSKYNELSHTGFWYALGMTVLASMLLVVALSCCGLLFYMISLNMSYYIIDQKYVADNFGDIEMYYGHPNLKQGSATSDLALVEVMNGRLSQARKKNFQPSNSKNSLNNVNLLEDKCQSSHPGSNSYMLPSTKISGQYSTYRNSQSDRVNSQFQSLKNSRSSLKSQGKRQPSREGLSSHDSARSNIVGQVSSDRVLVSDLPSAKNVTFGSLSRAVSTQF